MRVVFVPGFTQGASSWHPVLTSWSPGWWADRGIEVESLDVPDDLGFVDTARAIGDRGGRAVYVGYSMGGRLCLQLALDHPALVERLVLVSATPGIDDAAERAARRVADEDLARSAERDGVDTFLARWLAQPMFASLPPEMAGLDDRRRENSPARIAHQLRALGQGTQPSNWERLHQVRAPAALFVGGRDTKYVAIAEQMAPPMRAHMRVLHDVGHACHLEDPRGFSTLLSSWLGA